MRVPNYLDVIFLRGERGASVATYVNYFECVGPLQKYHIKPSDIFQCFVFLGVKELNILNRLIIGGFEPLYNPLMKIINVDLLFHLVESGLVFPCYHLKCKFIYLFFFYY